ncbi:MAG: hypothetical protein JO164_09330 [Candidatus Eremiobacteraeota bacterium]|nr:hypothetical protein [Candidatus Eremiobacteraeota bacterium]
MRFPPNRAPRSWWTFLGLTLASALIAHLSFDVAESGLSAVSSRPIHLLYGLVVLVALGGAAAELFRPGAAERRRRAALFRAGLHGNASASLIGSIGLQALLAAATLTVEGNLADRAHVLVAIASALIAIVVGALALRTVHHRALQLAAAIFAPREPARPRLAAFAPDLATLCAAERLYHLFRPNRPPPTFA